MSTEGHMFVSSANPFFLKNDIRKPKWNNKFVWWIYLVNKTEE